MNRILPAVLFCLSLAPASRAGVPAPQKELQRRYARTVLAHVRSEARKNSGAFVVRDDVLKREWRLKMVRIHTDRIVELGEGRVFACADLKEIGGEKTKLDLDFFVKKQGEDWVMEEVLVHKVAGKPRYTYNDHNERVPVP